jgi:hypothetical protein
VTFAVTGLFVYLVAGGRDVPDKVMSLVTVVISFYFGTVHEKNNQDQGGGQQ